MSLPGLERLAAVSPSLATRAAELGAHAWTGTPRTPRETAAAFLGADLALGLAGLPLELHTRMARHLGASDAWLADVISRVAPEVGFPQAAQALLALDLHPAGDDPATDDELRFGRRTARALLGHGRPDPSVADVVAEYGSLRC